MINIKSIVIEPLVREFNSDELTGDKWSKHRSAFIGSVGEIYSGVFLVTYNSIVLLSDPKVTWDEAYGIKIERFVDLDVIVRERLNEDSI